MTTVHQLRRLNDESRARLVGLDDLREQCQLATRHSRLRLEASRTLLERGLQPDPGPAGV